MVHVNPLTRFAVERRVTMGMVILGLFVLGWISLTRLPLEFLPVFSSSSVNVRAPYDSASPEEIERLIVRPLEDTLATIAGVETLTASASANEASINLVFTDGTDMDLVTVEVRDRIDRVRHLLPNDLERVSIHRFQSTDIPILRFHLTLREDSEDLYDFVEDVVQVRLERLEGVAQVDVNGLRDKQLQVQLNPVAMQARGVDVRRVVAALREGNVNVSSGYIEEGSRQLVVRVLGEFERPQEIMKLPLDGRGLRLQDIAYVDHDFPRQERFNYLNGSEALTVGIYKTSTANLLAVVDRVKSELAKIETLPASDGMTIRYLQDSSIDVRRGLGQLRDAGLLGSILAIVFLFLFLRQVQITLLVALAIPVSVLLTFVIIYCLREFGLTDITLNIVTLMGLILAIGMLVDNSIVVIESIFRHYHDLGKEPRAAALEGASDVAMPIVASTATTICVFMPVVFFASKAGGFMLLLVGIGIMICVVMISSLLVALTVVPMVAALILRRQSRRPSVTVEWLMNTYGRAVGFTLVHRPAFLLIVVGVLYGSWALFGTIERTFTPRTMERQISINVDTPRRFSLEQTKKTYREVIETLGAYQDELQITDIVYRFDRGSGRSRRGGGFGSRRGIDIFFVDEERARLSMREVRDRIRELLPTRAGVDFRITQSRGHGGRNFGVQLDLIGDDFSVLEMISERVVQELQVLPWVRDLDTTLENGDEEIRVSVNRERALQAGLSSQAVAFTVNNLLSSRPVSRMRTPDREIDLVVQMREEDRKTLDKLKKVQVVAGSDSRQLDSLARFEMSEGPRRIERTNRRPKITITANSNSQGTSMSMTRQLERVMNTLTLPAGYEWNFGRWARFAQQDTADSTFTLLFAALLIYLIMAALFESLVQPFTIMFSVPFAFIGVGIVLTLMNQPFDNLSNIGLVILIGVVVNNAIVLIHHVNQLRVEGMSRNEALVLGGRHRLRPILMTALTTMLGLVPMVAPLIFPGWLGTSEGRAGNWAPVGLVILAGLTTSTFLTLMIVPTIYSLVDDLSNFFKRVVRTI